MPISKNMQLRLLTLDRCFRQPQKRWTKQQLLNECISAYEKDGGEEKEVSLRTLSRDIRYMRDHLQAPIVVEDKKYYTYSYKLFSINDSPLDIQDLHHLQECHDLLQNFEGFSQVEALQDMIQRLEIYFFQNKAKSQQLLDHRPVRIGHGRQFLGPIYEGLQKKQCLRITYQPFKSEEKEWKLSPYYLKDYNGRWYVWGYESGEEGLRLLALDRILKVLPTTDPFVENTFIEPKKHFSQVIGVSVAPEQSPREIRIRLSDRQVPYLKSRPWHESQRLGTAADGSHLLHLRLIPNYELVSKILAMGADMEVLEPADLREEVGKKLKEATAKYA